MQPSLMANPQVAANGWGKDQDYMLQAGVSIFEIQIAARGTGDVSLGGFEVIDVYKNDDLLESSPRPRQSSAPTITSIKKNVLLHFRVNKEYIATAYIADTVHNRKKLAILYCCNPAMYRVVSLHSPNGITPGAAINLLFRNIYNKWMIESKELMPQKIEAMEKRGKTGYKVAEFETAALENFDLSMIPAPVGVNKNPVQVTPVPMPTTAAPIPEPSVNIPEPIIDERIEGPVEPIMTKAEEPTTVTTGSGINVDAMTYNDKVSLGLKMKIPGFFKMKSAEKTAALKAAVLKKDFIS